MIGLEFWDMDSGADGVILDYKLIGDKYNFIVKLPFRWTKSGIQFPKKTEIRNVPKELVTTLPMPGAGIDAPDFRVILRAGGNGEMRLAKMLKDELTQKLTEIDDQVKRMEREKLADKEQMRSLSEGSLEKLKHARDLDDRRKKQVDQQQQNGLSGLNYPMEDEYGDEEVTG